MKYFLSSLLIIILFVAFNTRKCVHVFTSVEQDTVNIQRIRFFSQGGYGIEGFPSAKQEGKDLICVKCFYRQKQILDYGQPIIHGKWIIDSALYKPFEFGTLKSSSWLMHHNDSCMTLHNGKVVFDSIYYY